MKNLYKFLFITPIILYSCEPNLVNKNSVPLSTPTIQPLINTPSPSVAPTTSVTTSIPTPTPTPSSSIVNLIIYPSQNITCGQDNTIQFFVKGYTNNGQIVDVPNPLWYSSNTFVGNIDYYGLFRANNLGVTRIIANVNNLTTYADVTVSKDISSPQYNSIPYYPYFSPYPYYSYMSPYPYYPNIYPSYYPYYPYYYPYYPSPSVTPFSPFVTNLKIEPSGDIVCAYDTDIQFKVIGYNMYGQKINVSNIDWSVEDSNIGTINSSGKFKPLKAGKTKINVSSNNLTATATVTVTSKNLSSFTISSPTLSTNVGGTIQFYAYGKDTENTTVTVTPIWTIADTKIGSIDNTGLFTAYNIGSSVITASVNNLTQTVVVNVVGGRLPIIRYIDVLYAKKGDTVKIYGDYFESTLNQNSVYFNGVKADIISGTSQELIVKVPENATTGYITIVTSAGQVTSPFIFTVLQ